MKKYFFCFILTVFLFVSGCLRDNKTDEFYKTMEQIDELNTNNIYNANIERIKNGDFTNVKFLQNRDIIDEYHNRILGVVYDEWIKGELELILRDINGDGSEELVWREKRYLQRLKVILTFKDDDVFLVFLHNGTARQFYFLSDSGYYVDFAWYSGIYSVDTFRFYTLDDYFIKTYVFGISAFTAFSFEELGDEWWSIHYPYIKKNGPGTYYQVFYVDKITENVPVFYTDENMRGVEYEYITENHFYYLFENTAGFRFE